MGVIVTLIVGAACGLINGLMVAKAKISEMITTLATMYLFLGLARGITGGDSVYAFDFASWCGNTMVGPIPIQLIFFAVMAVIFVIVLQKSTFGRKLFAIGLNKNAARYAGINVEKMQIIIFTVTGIVCALASFVYLGRFTSVKYDAGSNFNLNVITIVVLGGTSIMGGVGDMKGTLLGTLIIANSEQRPDSYEYSDQCADHRSGRGASDFPDCLLNCGGQRKTEKGYQNYVLGGDSGAAVRPQDV